MRHKLALAVALVLVVSAVLLRTGSVLGQEGEKAEPRSVEIDGFAVHGYANGNELGYEWYPTREEAEADKAVMEKTEDTNGKVYDKVTITPEKRRKLLPLKNQPQPQQSDPTPVQKLPSVDPGPMKPADKKYTVWVFKDDNGQWVKQSGMSFYTDDAKAARDMMAKVKARKGFTATTNAPEEPKNTSAAAKVEGTTWVRKQPNGLTWTLTFEQGGVVAYWDLDNDGQWRKWRDAHWTQNGDSVHLTMHDGAFEFTGTISGNQISGRARSGKGSLDWTINRQ